MGEDTVVITITKGGDVSVMVNGIMVGRLKEISMRAVARKDKPPLVNFRASRLDPGEYKHQFGMMSELSSVTFDSLDSFIEDVLEELPQGNSSDE